MTSIARSALPLSCVRVVDFGQYIAGPAVAMILGDLGATVVHVDPPGGPLWDNPANAILNRNKLIITLDLKTEEGWNRQRRWSPRPILLLRISAPACSPGSESILQRFARRGRS